MLLIGTDEEIRGAFIQVKGGNISTLWKWPIQDLYHLESYQCEDKDKDAIVELEQLQRGHIYLTRTAAEVPRKIKLSIEDSDE